MKNLFCQEDSFNCFSSQNSFFAQHIFLNFFSSQNSFFVKHIKFEKGKALKKDISEELMPEDENEKINEDEKKEIDQMFIEDL